MDEMEKDSPFIKGAAFGFTYESWIDEKETYLPSLLLSVMMNWQQWIDQDKPSITDAIRRKQLDEIERAINGMVSDLHNLAVNYHLMASTISNDQYKGTGLIGLYLSLLTENYITNIRSIYDFCSVFPRIIMSTKNIESYRKFHAPDTLWTLINAILGKARVANNATGERLSVCEETLTETVSEFPYYLKALILNISQSLNIINKIRNGIVHKGDEPFIQLEADRPIIRLPDKYPGDKTNKLPNILGLDESVSDYPLFDYLRVLTHDLFEFMENLGAALFRNDYPFNLWILDNKCMEAFTNYFRYDIGKHIRKTADGKSLEFGIVGVSAR